MRRILLLALLGAACSTTDPTNARVIASQPFWMEWPAEVVINEPLAIRLVQWSPGCFPVQSLRVGVTRTASEIRLEAEFYVEGESNVLCVRTDPGPVDTTVTIAGIAAAGTYDVAIVHPDPQVPAVRGTIAVRATDPVDRDRIRGAGYVTGGTDIEGCPVMIRLFDPPIPVENPPAATWQGFVRGYSFTPASPVCGQTRAFHVDSVE